MPRPKKAQIEVNSKKSLTELMQEAYNDANNQINQTQNVINNLSSWESPENDKADDVAKINKEKVNALKVRDSAIRIKTDLARLQSEIIKHEGNKEAALDDAENSNVSEIDFKKLREAVNKEKNGDQNE